MHYTTTDPLTGIEVTAVRQEDRSSIVMLVVPTYDGFDDEHALRMQARAAGEVIVALNTLDRALSRDRVVRKRSRSVGRNIWRLVDRAPQCLDVRGVVAYPASLC